MHMMHFAGHIGGTTVFTLPGVEAVQHVRPRCRPHDLRQVIDCRVESRELVEMLQSKDLHDSLLATYLLNAVG
jgi:hypothetical protein